MELIRAVSFATSIYLAIVSWQVARTYQSAAFKIISTGWLLSVISTLSYYIYPWHTTLSSFKVAQTLTVVFEFGSAMAFLIAARINRQDSRIAVGRSLLVIAAAVYAIECYMTLMTSTIRFSESHLFVRLMVIVINIAATSSLYEVFRRFLADHGRGIPAHPLIIGSLMYVVAQAFAFAWVFGRLEYVNLGTSLGAVAKGTMLTGLLLDQHLQIRQQRLQAETVRISETLFRRLIHEIGTPLAELILHAERLRKLMPSKEKSRETLDAIDSAVARIAAILDSEGLLYLVSDLLPSTSIRSQDSDWRIVNLNSLVHRAITAVKMTRGEPVIFKIQFQGRCHIRCVPAEIVQVVVNLLRNAYDAMPNRRGFIRVTTQLQRRALHEIDKDRGVAEAEVVCLVIEDNGEGIPQGYVQKVFEEGFSTRGTSGRGFGLAVVETLVEKNGGEIEIRSNTSTPDQGTSVQLLFPRTSISSERR
jgi:signal transduction histidine kinase